jgi:hypothetical protein
VNFPPASLAILAKLEPWNFFIFCVWLFSVNASAS